MAIQQENKVHNLTTTETWQHQYIVTNGIRMHYVTQGEGPLIVLLHGFPEFWYSWHNQIPYLAEHGYTVVAPDLRGYNETDKPRKGYDIPTLLRDIEGLIKGLGQQKAHIVGHDWGGVLAWTFANGQTISGSWNGAVSQSGANVTVSEQSGQSWQNIPAGGSYSGFGFNGTWNGTTNSIPATFALNGTACTVN